MKRILITAVVALLFSLQALAADSDLDKRVEHGYANSSGVKIHYASLGSKDKPLIVMIHGFPDFWYTWRDQMEALSKDYQVVAIDQRGYTLSDKPKGVENYDVRFLVGDVAAVIKHLGREKAIVVGHDWGGMVAWATAMAMPQIVDKLIILNLPHPRGIARELATNPEQQKNSQYARNFQKEEVEGRTVGLLGEGSQSARGLHRGLQAFGYGSDAQLLQAQLSARALH